MMIGRIFSSILAVVTVVTAQTFSPAKPPAIPLAVRSPYMSTWLQAGQGSDGTPDGNGGFLAGEWPSFWHGEITGWAGLIRVDNESYTWMGDPAINNVRSQAVTQSSFEYTSTRSTFIQQAGRVTLNVSFISPITPNDYARQSTIGSYLEVSVSANDGALHQVQLYADTSAEWVAGDSSAIAEWDFNSNDGIASHTSWRQTQFEFSETNQRADWGTWFWSTQDVTGLSWQSGADTTVRGNFLLSGSLPDSKDTAFRAINDEWPVFAFSHDLGSVESAKSVVYSLVLAQDNAIQFAGAQGTVALPSLWKSYYASDLDMANAFYSDYPTATNLSSQVDAKFNSDSYNAGGQNYSTITTLSARQAYGGVQIVGTADKMYGFLKEISSDGNVDTVDVLFPAIPIFIYSNPTYVKLLLDPLFENQEAGLWPNTYAMHDLGSSYPNATGHPDGNAEAMPLEECGNMIIATLAYSQRASDTAYLTEHYAILKQWNNYLVAEALIPANQLSTDDFAGQLANQTNLALKGIIAIQAMSTIANLTGNSADASNFSDIAHDYIAKWQGYAVVSSADPPHTNLQYGNDSSHGLLYNLYSDKLLGLGLVPQSIYDMQSAFYPTVALPFGVSLDTRHTYTKSDWEMWTAAIATPSTRDVFVSALANYVANSATNYAFGDWYYADTSEYPVSDPFRARPVVGGHFALLALDGAPIAAGTKRDEGLLSGETGFRQVTRKDRA